MENKMEREYLGDSVYVERQHTGTIVLTTNNGVEISNTIVLEEEVIYNLLKFIKKGT
jgi:hypothetical protein